MSKENWTYNVGLCGTMGRSVGVTDVVGGVLGSDGSLSFLGGSVSSVGGSLGVFGFNFYDGKVLSGDYSVRNFYDKRGMLIASQNVRQAGLNLYSYYIYDAKGRLIEVGEIENLVGLTDVLVEDIKGYYDWFNGGVLKDVTVMGYDDNFGNLGSGGNYTRNRLYMVGRFTPGGKWGRGNPEYVSLISYDEHGNVQSVLNRLNSSDVLRRDVVKRVDYEYDLLSGDVRRVYYQRGKVDQLIHRYDYDDRGRLKSVWTSRDGEFWDRDGKYFYSVVDGYDANGNILMQRRDVGVNTVANYSYHYSKLGDRLVSNRLYHVGGLSDDGDLGFSGDNVVGTGCYGYDGIGELVKDRANGIERVDWDMFGKVRRVVRSAGSLLPDLEFRYDGMGRRVCKIVKPRDEGNRSLLPESDWLWEWYVRDLDGNVMAMYEDSVGVLEGSTDRVVWQKLSGRVLYGSGRLGVDNKGAGAVRQGMLIGCVDVSACGHGMGWDEFTLVVNGDVLVDGFWRFLNLEGEINSGGDYEARLEGDVLKLWYIGGNPASEWVVVARRRYVSGTSLNGFFIYSTVVLPVGLCVDEGECFGYGE